MVSMDIFNNDAFSATSMSDAVEKINYKPQLLGELGIFEPEPIRTTSISIESKSGVLSLIPVTERGAPVPQQTRDPRSIRDFRTVRLAKGDTIYAHEIQNIRAFGKESELQQVMDEVASRQAKLRDDVDLTHEHMRLGAVQGKVVDADGVTVINDWYDEWGVEQPEEIDFELDESTTDVNEKCRIVERNMQRAAQGAWVAGTRAVGLASDGFYDKLIKHASVKETYINWSAAEALRGDRAWRMFPFGGIDFINYRGTDDNTTVAVEDGKCKFFPRRARGAFKVAWGPGESFDLVNRPGRPVFSHLIPDRDRNSKVEVEVYSYPLFICTRPLMLQRAKAQ